MSSFTKTNRDLSYYTNINKWDRTTNSYIGIAIADKLTQKNGQDYKLVDAVDIDWNGLYIAQANAYINHTEDLALLLDSIININNFSEVSVRIDKAEITLSEIIASYVSKDELNTTLRSYQPRLTSGAYIKISNDVISAYNVLSQGDIESKFSTKEELGQFITEVYNNYYTKEGVSTFLHNTVIKNADPNFNDLEKISNWIKKQSKFVEVDMTYIENHPDQTYYKYNSNREEYVEVTLEEIHNNPTETYYTLKDTNQNIDDLIRKIEEIDETVGHKNNDGTYTGILKDIDSLYYENEVIRNEVDLANQVAQNAQSIASVSYNLAYNSYLYSYTSYNLADTAYSYSVDSITYSSIAYTTVNELSTVIGHDTIPTHYESLTEEDIAEIKENGVSDFGYEIYRKDGDNYYRMYTYDEDAGYEYYKKVAEQAPTGFYKDLADTEKVANEALYNLSYTNEGDTTYAYISMSPMAYSGNPQRNLKFTLNTGEVSYETGEIVKEGIATTLVLKDSFTYLTYFVTIPGEHD